MTKAKTSTGNTKLSILLAMAMFVLVVDTSLMNVSISAVVTSLHTTVSGVQSVIALEALISAAFILINSKLGDIFGRKRSYIIGLCAYAVGALSMVLAHNLITIIIFWAVVGGLGASLLLPAMQSLIHGNFNGAAQKKTYALVGAAAAIAAAVGPLLGGVITTFLSYRVAFLLEFLIIVIVLLGSKLVKDVKYKGSRKIDFVGAFLSVVGMGGVVLGILAWQEGGERVGMYITVGIIMLVLFAEWLLKRERENKSKLIDPKLFRFPNFRLGFSGQMMQNIVLGGAMIALPIFLQVSLEYNALKTGLSIAPLSLSMFAVAIIAGKRFTNLRSSRLIKYGFGLTTIGLINVLLVIPRADSGWLLALPLLIVGSGLGLLVSQLNNYTLAPIEGERVSEAAGVNSAAGSFGLSFGLAMAGGILLAALSFSFSNLTNDSSVIPNNQKQQIAQHLETRAEVVSNSQLQSSINNQPQNVQNAVLEINKTATHRALQFALLIPLVAAVYGTFNAFKMEKLPEIKSSAEADASMVG